MDLKQTQMREKLEEKIDLADAKKSMADIKKNGGIPFEEIKKKYKL